MRITSTSALALASVVGAALLTVPGSISAHAQSFRIDAPGIHVGVGERHHHRDYHEYRRRGYGAYAADPGHPYGYNVDYGDPRCGRPNFTIQDGVCKPYTGR